MCELVSSSPILNTKITELLFVCFFSWSSWHQYSVHSVFLSAAFQWHSDQCYSGTSRYEQQSLNATWQSGCGGTGAYDDQGVIESYCSEFACPCSCQIPDIWLLIWRCWRPESKKHKWIRAMTCLLCGSLALCSVHPTVTIKERMWKQHANMRVLT